MRVKTHDFGGEEQRGKQSHIHRLQSVPNKQVRAAVDRVFFAAMKTEKKTITQSR